MAMDLKKSFASVVLEKSIATAVTIPTEGVLLSRVVEAGVEKVRPSAAAGSEVVVGFSMTNNEQPATTPVIESLTAPTFVSATAPMQLAHTNLVGTNPSVEIRIVDTTTSTTLTQVASATNPNEFSVDNLTGIVTLVVGQSGHALTVYYRRNLTVVESQQLFFQPNVNNTSGAVLGLVGVFTGKGQMFTMEYDASKDYSVASPAIVTGASGKITIGGGGTSITSLMRVIKAPTASDLSLGLEFNI